jgi:hypothetical protein
VNGGVTPTVSVAVSVSARVTAWCVRSSQQCAQVAASAIAQSFSIGKWFGGK